MMQHLPTIFWTLLEGAWIAAKIAAGAGLIAFLLGMLLALVDVFIRVMAVRAAIAAFVEWMRNVPALAHLFVLYFGLASVGIKLSPIAAAVIGLGLVGAATLCEVFASGMRALHVGQREAALAVGLTPAQALRHVLLPQMLRLTLPSVANYAAQLIKDTSIASAIVLYAAIVFPVSWMLARFERKLGVGQ